jgi:peptidyl-prolyl cis-trans isomerase SurA
LDDKAKESPVITMDLVIGKWEVVAFQENGEDFGSLAAEYSDDPGSARRGGNLGFASRGQMVPEYEAAAMRMKPGQISMPVESDFGYHLIQLIERRGNEYNSRHILIRPDYTTVDFEAAERFLDSLRTLILEDSIIFENMAKEFSDDEETAGTGGFMIDANGSSIVSVEDLDPVIFFTIDTMNLGDISHPMRYRMKDGKEAVRIIYYKDRIKPHKANFKDDFQKIHLAALNEKRTLKLDEWFNEAKNEVFIQIDEDYKKCRILE